MPIATRLTSNGTYYVNGLFDEISLTSIRISTDTVYTAEFDETAGIGVAKRELSTGVLQVAGEFDEFTGVPVADSSLRFWVDAAQSASYPGTGSSWNNLSPATSTVTLYNGPAFDNIDGGGSLVFTPSSLQYGDNNANLGNMSTFTVEAWAKVTASLTGQVTAIVTNQYNLASSLNFSIGTNNAPTNYNLVAGFFNGAWRNSSTTGFNPTLNQWYHFLGTYDGSTLNFYVNGSLHSSLSYTGTPSSGGTIRIARRWDDTLASGNLFPGEIGVVRIYNRALSLDEITTNFNAHRNRYGI